MRSDFSLKSTIVVRILFFNQAHHTVTLSRNIEIRGGFLSYRSHDAWRLKYEPLSYHQYYYKHTSHFFFDTFLHLWQLTFYVLLSSFTEHATSTNTFGIENSAEVRALYGLHLKLETIISSHTIN